MPIVILYGVVSIAFGFKVFESIKEIKKGGFKKEKVWRLLYSSLLLITIIMLFFSKVNKL